MKNLNVIIFSHIILHKINLNDSISLFKPSEWFQGCLTKSPRTGQTFHLGGLCSMLRLKYANVARVLYVDALENWPKNWFVFCIFVFSSLQQLTHLNNIIECLVWQWVLVIFHNVRFMYDDDKYGNFMWAATKKKAINKKRECKTFF